ELDTRELAAKTTRQRAYQQGFAQPRYAFDQHMAAGDQRGKHTVDDLLLPDDRLVQFLAQGMCQLAGALALDFDLSGVTGRIVHSAFLRLCMCETWRVNSAALRRVSRIGRSACSTSFAGRRLRVCSSRHCSA